jgi:hypothetical protein
MIREKEQIREKDQQLFENQPRQYMMWIHMVHVLYDTQKGRHDDDIMISKMLKLIMRSGHVIWSQRSWLADWWLLLHFLHLARVSILRLDCSVCCNNCYELKSAGIRRL